MAKLGKTLVLILCTALLAAASTSAVSAQQGSSATDRAALVALYNATNGANWVKKGNWLNDDVPLSSWYGVTTDSGDRVSRLKLFGNQLNGEIPSELGNLVKLKELRLENNSLRGEIPAGLGDLANLEWLYLYGNQLSGEIPPELGKLASLVELRFGDNQLRGEIPPELGDLAKLEWLGLLNNQLSGDIPAELGKLTNLVTLYLEGNQLSGCLPRVLLQYRLNKNLSRLGGLPFCSDAPAPFAQDWLIRGVAKRDSLGSVVLTPAARYQLGFLMNPSPINTQRLSIEFSFEIKEGSGADGLALVLARNLLDDPPPGSRYGGRFASPQFVDGIAVEIDTHPNGWDISGNHIGISRLGGSSPVDLASVDVQQDFRQNGEFNVQVIIDNARIQVFLSNADLGMDRTSLLDHTIEDFDPVGRYLGFVGTTGAATDRHIIHNVEIKADGVPVPPTPTPPPNAGQQADRAALVALYHATNGPSWRNKTNWLNDDAPLSSWRGVATDSGGRVTELKLSSNQLNGEIPAELGNLSNLTVLNLAVNDLSGSIPASVGTLSELTELNLHSSGLSGPIPQNLVNLGKLSRLQLRGNGFSGCVPDSLYGVEDNDLNQLGLPKCSTASQPLGVPSNLRAAPGGSNDSVVLSWSPGANATGHIATFRKKAGGEWESRLFAGNARSATITGLEAGQEYYFAVRAVRERGGKREWSDWSDVVDAMPGLSPGVPSNLRAAPGSSNDLVVLSWTPGANATGHQVAIKKRGREWDDDHKRVTVAGNAAGTTITGLEAEAEYRFAVRAYRGSGSTWKGSNWIATRWVKVTVGPPLGDPWNLRATPGRDDSEVVLTWRPGANATGHRVAFRKKAVREWQSRFFAGNVGGTTIAGLELGQEYLFVVRAFRGSGDNQEWSEWSEIVEAAAAPSNWRSALADRAALMSLYRVTQGEADRDALESLYVFLSLAQYSLTLGEKPNLVKDLQEVCGTMLNFWFPANAELGIFPK